MPSSATSSAETSSTTVSASSSVARLHRNELIEHLWQREEIGRTAGRRPRTGILAEPIDPHAAQPELLARGRRRGRGTPRRAHARRATREYARRTRPSGGGRACTSRSPVRRPPRRTARRSGRAMPRCSRCPCSRGHRASQPRCRRPVSAPCTSGNERHAGSDSAEGVLLARRGAQPPQRLGQHFAVAAVRLAAARARPRGSGQAARRPARRRRSVRVGAPRRRSSRSACRNNRRSPSAPRARAYAAICSGGRYARISQPCSSSHASIV